MTTQFSSRKSIYKASCFLLLVGLMLSSMGWVSTANTLVAQAASSLPVDLSSDMPPVRDQGIQGSCVAWALAYYYKSYQEKVEHGWAYDNSTLFSPSYVYNQVATSNDGLSSKEVERALQLIVDQGVAPWSSFPYNDQDWYMQPWPAVRAVASNYKAKSYQVLPNIGDRVDDLAVLKEHLANRDPFVLLIPLYTNYVQFLHWNSDIRHHVPTVIDDPSGPNWYKYPAGHAITIVGYDDAMQRFKFINSWGTDWGENGFGYVTYRFVLEVVGGTHALFMVDQTGSSADTTAPSGSWISPSNGSTISSSSITLSVNASDNPSGSGVREVRFSAKWNNQWSGIGNDSSAPYSVDWNWCNFGVPNGDVELGMEVWDNANNKWVYSEHSTNYHITKNYNCGPPPGKWHAQYFSDHNWSSLKCERDLNGGADFDEDWGAGSPPCGGIPTDNFSARYTGTFSFGSAGTYWFKVHHDDGATLWIDSNQHQWSSSGDDCVKAENLIAGQHALRIDYQENTGGASVGIKVLSSECFPTPTPPPPGLWHAQYFSNHDWSSEKCHLEIIGSGIIGADFSENWDGGAPCPGMPTDNFSARYTGTFNVGSTADYCFHVNHDDTARLNIDGEDLQNWTHSGDDGPVRNLTAGRHNFLIDYQENTGSAHISLEMFYDFCFPPGSSSKKSPTGGAIDQSTNNLTLTWELNSSATSYEYCYDITDDNACSSWIPAGTATLANLPSLSPHTTYYWQVRATNIRGSTETNEKTWWSFRTTDTQPPHVSTTVIPTSVNLGDTATVTVALNNVPAEGYTGAEFTCTYNQTLLEVSNITIGSLFGVDTVSAINGPQNGSFIVAIAGSKGNKATTSGAAFTFNVKALQAGQTSVECKARVSKGDGNIIVLLSMGPAPLTIGGTITPTFTPTDTPTPTPSSTSTPTASQTPTPSSTPTATASVTPTQPRIGTLTGQVLATEPVIVRLYDATNTLVTSIPANPDGNFSLTAPAGTYTVVAIASGFLSARGSITIMGGNAATLPTISLLAGDIDNNNVIDQFDAMTIGMNYNTITPSAADLNNDGVINVLDLELLAANYRDAGPIVWQ